MELITTKDIILRGTAWDKAVESYSSIFKSRPYYNLFLLAASIGIVYDKRIEKLEENGEQPKTLPRNVIDNQERSDHRFDVMAQTAILQSKTINYSDEERMKIAFDDQDTRINAIDLLEEFANFGVTKLVEKIGTTEIETMENLKDFLAATVEGCNFELVEIPDDELLNDLQTTDLIDG